MDMNSAERIELAEPVESTGSIIQLPLGLLGFEKVTNYTLLGSPEESPFLWLQMVEDPSLFFLVVPPGQVVENYEPDISDEDGDFLELENSQDALVLNIVTVHCDGQATVNLKGPIVVNRFTLRGKQVIPRNVSSFSLQHPLQVARD